MQQWASCRHALLHLPACPSALHGWCGTSAELQPAHVPPVPPHPLQLPPAPVLGPAAQALPHDQQLPPLLIINLQLPWYPVGGCSTCAGRLLPHTFLWLLLGGICRCATL